ncbi:MAG: tripartite tricarboxylate transporter substrate binding protein [Alphaproteobacteria bacterium]|nr:tripartite tricarboxylate transporter substrate binding protein [Alphaproteobacteria bacterium]
MATSPRLTRRAVIQSGLGTVASLGLPLTAWSQGADNYPNRPVKVLVPYAPGGATDIIARLLSIKLAETLGQNVVVENRPGASGNIALEAAIKSPPDGYTLFVGNVTTNAINETTIGTVKPSRDLAGITRLVEIPHVLAVSPQMPAQFNEFVELVRANPRKYNYGSAGLGSYPHLDTIVLNSKAQMQMVHVPYKNGAAGIIPALLANEIMMSFINMSSVLEHLRVGKINAIASVPSTRLAELPQVPTLTELGYPNVGTNAWQGLFAPVATPKPIQDKLFAAVTKVMHAPDVLERLQKGMMTLALSASPQEWTDSVRQQTQQWAEVVRANQVKID